MKTFISIITKMFANMILDEIEKLNSMLHNVETLAHDFVNQLDVDTIREILPIVKALHDAGATDEEIVQAIMLGKPQFEQDLANDAEDEKFRQDLKALSIMTGIDFSSIFDDLEGNKIKPDQTPSVFNKDVNFKNIPQKNNDLHDIEQIEQFIQDLFSNNDQHETPKNANEDQDDLIDALTEFLSGTKTVPVIIRVHRK